MKLKLVFILFVLSNVACNQQPKKQLPFWEDIQAFKKQDSVKFPPKNATLFIGSSSFTRWTDVQDYFPGFTIINRGFGSSTLADQINYVNEIVVPYQPKQIVIYCGENDLAFVDTVSAQTVFSRFQILFTDIRSKLHDVPIVYISMKPSPSRWHLRDKMIEANSSIKNYLAGKDKTVFLDLWQKMLNAEGKPNGELFIQDSLHLNAKGYSLWTQELTPHLIRN
jgi:lysophospholipase L1-like esterase